jgi:hypothetical protein
MNTNIKIFTDLHHPPEGPSLELPATEKSELTQAEYATFT